MIHKRFTGDSENDLKINIFLKVGESDVDLDADSDTDVVFKDPAMDSWICFADFRVANSINILISV